MSSSSSSSAPALPMLLLVAACFVASVSGFSPSYKTRPSTPVPRSSLYASTAAETVAEGITKTVLRPGRPEKPVNLGDIATVKYSCYVANEPGAFAKSERQKMIVGDGSMIPAWDRALRSMSVGESATVFVSDPKLGYGTEGVPPLIPPNSPLEFTIEVLDAQPPTTNIDFDSIAMADDTPTTASEIAAAFERRQAEKLRTQGPAKEGLEGFIEKAKGFYFFGLFEGETGQQAPWFLRPSITFPLAFLVVGAAFYVSYVSGGIYERGATVTDELDEIILTNIIASIHDTARSAVSITSEHMS